MIILKETLVIAKKQMKNNIFPVSINCHDSMYYVFFWDTCKELQNNLHKWFNIITFLHLVKRPC